MPVPNYNDITLDGFAQQSDFFEFVMKVREEDLMADEHNRARGTEDVRFALGFQWPEGDEMWRKQHNIPIMTFNLAPSLLRHRLGARARKRIGPKLTPINAGQQYDGIAQIREGFIRHIEVNSNITGVDSVVSQNQLIAGIGHYEVTIEYANSDAFDLDIFIRTDPNPWSVIWDAQSVEPTGKDARRVIKETLLDRADFERMFPGAQANDIGHDPVRMFGASSMSGRRWISDWVSRDTVRVATVWLMRERYKNIAYLTNDQIVDIGDTPPEDFRIPDGFGGHHTVVIGQNGEYKARRSPCKYAVGYLTNGVELLAEPYEMEIDRVPIVRVPAWMMSDGSRMQRFGMVHFAKDAMKFYNFVKSDRIERIVYRNRATYQAHEDDLSPEQLETYRNAHKLRGGVLLHRGQKPTQVEPLLVDEAAIIETKEAQEAIYNIFDIRPGLAGEQGRTPPSGISLEHQMTITDSGGLIYDEAFVSAKAEVYSIINQLIPLVCDAPRTIKVVGSDGKIAEALINSPDDPESVDVTIGKYSVAVSTAPSHETQRAMTAQMLETAMNANPGIIPFVLPKSLALLNVPGTEAIIQEMERLAGTAEPTEEEAAAAAEEQARQQAIIDRMTELELQNKALANQKLAAEAAAREAAAAGELSRAKQDEDMISLRMSELAEKIANIAAQTDKIYAEINRLNNPLPKQTEGGNGND